MIPVTLAYRHRGTPTVDTIKVKVPMLPLYGTYISHEPSGINGYVDGVSFWWPKDGSPLHIEVALK